MAFKTVIFVSLLVGAIALGEAQLGGPFNGLFGLLQINGQLFCTVDGNIGVNGTATPVFSNAMVQLQCGAGNVVSTATTNGAGLFSILLNPLQFILSSLLKDCNLAVKTPLSNCNATLPSVGRLFSSLQVLENTIVGLLNITWIIPQGFQLLPTN